MKIQIMFLTLGISSAAIADCIDDFYKLELLQAVHNLVDAKIEIYRSEKKETSVEKICTKENVSGYSIYEEVEWINFEASLVHKDINSYGLLIDEEFSHYFPPKASIEDICEAKTKRFIKSGYTELALKEYMSLPIKSGPTEFCKAVYKAYHLLGKDRRN